MKNLITEKPILFAVAIIVVMIVAWVAYNTYTRATSTATETPVAEGLETAYFAGGCFWCIEADYEKFDGVKEAISGYMGGTIENPTYQNHGDHRETVEVRYNPDQVSYEKLVQYFFRIHDPTDEGGSFYDRGHSYTSAIYPQNDQEERIAAKVIQDLEQKQVFENPIVTSIEQGATFWTAEDYHQDYYKKNVVRYKAYRLGSGRDAFIKSAWGNRDDFKLETNAKKMTDTTNETNRYSSYKKPSDEVLKEQLTPLQYDVTQKEGTEAPRSEGNLNDNHEDGIYVDILSGEPLYSSRDKFKSGTGWPSFTKPISDEFIITKKDKKLFFSRTEVRSKYADNHIGHVFNDGPEPRGERWCMNGAAMTFIPLDQMEEKGYGEYIDKVN